MSESPWRAALGQRIREARQAKGWSWGMVERRSRVPVATWRRVERGRPAKEHALIWIAKDLGWPRGECYRILADALDKEDAG